MGSPTPRERGAVVHRRAHQWMPEPDTSPGDPYEAVGLRRVKGVGGEAQLRRRAQDGRHVSSVVRGDDHQRHLDRAGQVLDSPAKHLLKPGGERQRLG